MSLKSRKLEKKVELGCKVKSEVIWNTLVNDNLVGILLLICFEFTKFYRLTVYHWFKNEITYCKCKICQEGGTIVKICQEGGTIVKICQKRGTIVKICKFLLISHGIILKIL